MKGTKYRHTWKPHPYLAFGVAHDGLPWEGKLAYERWVLLLGLFTLRVHRFHPGVNPDKVPHAHPWWFFITFPFRGYAELVDGKHYRWVSPWRPHFRRGSFRHTFLPPKEHRVWTLVLTAGERYQRS